MGTILTVAGADFSANAIGYNAPNTRGLVGLYLQGTALSNSLKNLASGGASGAAPVGSPTPNTGYVEFTQGSYLSTPIVDSVSETIIVAARLPAYPTAGNTWVAGNFGASKGAAIFVSYSTASTLQATTLFTPTAGGSAVQKTVTVPYAAGSFQMVALVIDNVAATIQLFNLTTGVSGTAVATGGTLVTTTATAQIGAAPQGASQTGVAVDVALAEFHNVALTATELTALYAAWKPVLANRGIAV